MIIGGTIIGDPDRSVNYPATLETAKEANITFYANEKYDLNMVDFDPDSAWILCLQNLMNMMNVITHPFINNHKSINQPLFTENINLFA